MENTGAKTCPCKRTRCPRHGCCEVCREHHHSSLKKPLTTCERLERKDTGGSRKRERSRSGS